MDSTNYGTKEISEKVEGILSDSSFMFSNHKDVYKKGLEKKQRKLLLKIPKIQNYLTENEFVKAVTSGTTPIHITDWLFTGSISYYIKRALFVFTNKRILVIPTTHRYKFKDSVSQINYSDIKEVSTSFMFGNLTVKYKNNVKESFLYFKEQKKKIKLMLKNMAFTNGPSTTESRTFLCPSSKSKLTDGIAKCPQCNLEFLDKKVGFKRSLLIPGGGYFYTRHYILGVFDCLGELFLLFLLFGSILMVIDGDPDGVVTLIIVASLLVLEKYITIYHSNHFISEFIPKHDIVKEAKP